jgi:hypothetical protein
MTWTQEMLDDAAVPADWVARQVAAEMGWPAPVPTHNPHKAGDRFGGILAELRRVRAEGVAFGPTHETVVLPPSWVPTVAPLLGLIPPAEPECDTPTEVRS